MYKFPFKRLKLLRKEKELTIAQASEKIGIGSRSLYRYESGKINPSLETLILLSLFYRVSCDYLLGLTDVPEVSALSGELNSEELEYLRLLGKMNPCARARCMERIQAISEMDKYCIRQEES